MEPITTVTTAWSIAKTAGEISKKLYEFGKSLKDRDAKQQVDEILEKLRELKQSASGLQDGIAIFERSCVSRVMTTSFILHSGMRKRTLTSRFAQSALRARLLRRWANRGKDAKAIVSV